MKASALIAEDEPLLAQALGAELAQAWPQLKILASVGDGASALAQALALQPDVLFLDIRMPGMSGMDVAADLADAWPFDAPKPFPLIVFVTAYDQYAVHAFEAQALDYLLKPVQPERLQKTVARLQAALAERAALQVPQRPASTQAAQTAQASTPSALDQAVQQLRVLLSSPTGAAQVGGQGAAKPAPLQVIQASEPGSEGQRISLVPISEVIYFEAADKYVRVLCAEREHLIRTPLKELMPQLDAAQFWQVHRSLVVRASAISEVRRDEAGKLSIGLHHRKERLAVSRLYAHLFKAM